MLWGGRGQRLVRRSGQRWRHFRFHMSFLCFFAVQGHIALAALAFALAHYSPGPALVVFVDLLSVFVDGVIYGLIYYRSRNIFVS